MPKCAIARFIRNAIADAVGDVIKMLLDDSTSALSGHGAPLAGMAS